MAHLHPYIPLAMLILIAMGFAAVSLLAAKFVGPQRPNPSKSLPYESGMIPFGEANVRVPIKFYMVAILFLLFDIEAVYMLAWALVFRGRQFADKFETDAMPFTQGQFQRFAFLEMMTFIAILLVGYVYVWKKGGLRWS